MYPTFVIAMCLINGAENHLENGLRVTENKHQERWKNQWWVTSDEQLPHMWMKWTHAWRGMWWTKKQLIISNSRRIAQKHGNANSEAASDTFSAIVWFWRFFSLKTLYLFCSKKQKNTLHRGHICKHFVLITNLSVLFVKKIWTNPKKYPDFYINFTLIRVIAA